MSEPVKKVEGTPESYSPKNKPDIISMIEGANTDTKNIEPQYLIDAVFPTGDNPWVGGSDYLRCFASQYMHLEGMQPSHDTRYWLYRKFLAVTGMGMVTTFTADPDGQNYTFEAAYDYIGRLHRFAGYGYNVIKSAGQDKNELFEIIARSIYFGRPVLAVFKGSGRLYKFNRRWRLFVGYNFENKTLSVNEDGTVSVLADWFEQFDSAVIVTQTGLPRPDIKDVLNEIIKDAERSEAQGEKYGYNAYEGLISRLNDDAFFQNAGDTALEQLNKALGSFFWYHAESRGATGEGYGQLCEQELGGTEYQTDVSCNGFWGYNGHQSSYIGCMALRKGPAALREKSHRDILAYALRRSMSNDAKIIWMIKRAIGIDTPDVLSPKDASGQPVDYCHRAKEMMMWDSKDIVNKESAVRMSTLKAETILSKCKAVNTYFVDFNNDIEVGGKIDTALLGNLISVKTEDNIYGTNGYGISGFIKTRQTFSAPLKIDACIVNKETAFLLSYNNGFLKNSSWGGHPGSGIHIWDIYVNYVMDFNPEFPAIQTKDINISWILQRDYMAVIVNNELVHYSENFPYTHFEMPVAPVGFSAFDNQTVTVKSLTVSELE